MYLSEKTVKNYVSNLLAKLGMSRRTEAAVYAVRRDREQRCSQVGDDEMIMEDLNEAECLDLLASHHFGRIGVVVDGQPIILPVNYVFDDGRVAIQDRPGHQADRCRPGPGGFRSRRHRRALGPAGACLVTGVGYEVTDALDDDERSATRRFPVDTWAPGQKTRWIRIEPESITVAVEYGRPRAPLLQLEASATAAPGPRAYPLARVPLKRSSRHVSRLTAGKSPKSGSVFESVVDFRY